MRKFENLKERMMQDEELMQSTFKPSICPGSAHII